MIEVVHIAVCMKPIEGNFAENALVHGVAGINVDGCRVAGESWGSRPAIKLTSKGKVGGGFGQTQWETIEGERNEDKGLGRWPANLIHDGSDEVVGLFPETTTNKGTYRTNRPMRDNLIVSKENKKDYVCSKGDSGSASRFFKECEQNETNDD